MATHNPLETFHAGRGICNDSPLASRNHGKPPGDTNRREKPASPFRAKDRDSATWDAEDKRATYARKASCPSTENSDRPRSVSRPPIVNRRLSGKSVDSRMIQQWDISKYERLVNDYLAIRTEIWKPLADRFGEQWETLENKFVSLELRDVHVAAESIMRRSSRELRHTDGACEDDADSTYGSVRGSINYGNVIMARTLDLRPRSDATVELQPDMMEAIGLKPFDHSTESSLPTSTLSNDERQQKDEIRQSLSDAAPLKSEVDDQCRISASGAIENEDDNSSETMSAIDQEESAISVDDGRSSMQGHHSIGPTNRELDSRLCLRNIEDVVSQIVRSYRDRLLDSLMKESGNLMTQGSIVSHAGGAETSQSTPQAGSSSSNGTSTSTRRRNARHGKKRLNSSYDDENEEDSSKRERLDAAPSEANRRLACPYYRRCPERHAHWRSCAGPGWDSVHRVKEHVYRRHKLPIYCSRCWKEFQTSTELDDHYRQLQLCETLPKRNTECEGYDKEQEKILKKRTKDGKTEHEKWNEMYRILFPSGDEATIPTPYYDTNAYASWKRDRNDELNRCEQCLRAEFPRLIQERLQEVIGPLDNLLSRPLIDDLSMKIIDIARDFQAQAFRACRNSVHETTDPSIVATEQNQMADYNQLSDEAFEPSQFPNILTPPMFSEHNFDFYNFPYDLSTTGAQNNTTDSGYASTGNLSNGDFPGISTANLPEVMPYMNQGNTREPPVIRRKPGCPELRNGHPISDDQRWGPFPFE
ncbi:hypothetical protein F5Y15DRAFT_112066 [Xylariaceae sp. FL0016]|nr:hypothetical protein F5Y15DRAFT_112066 [Xylariaceae sp. FL0016]